ncbi:MAG: vitamin B12 dependent-methionine synthase activation domain-containing protein, partial [bacterium]
MHGRYPELLDDALVGPTARKLFADAEAMLARIAAEGWIEPRGVVGIFPAHADGDDLVIEAGGAIRRAPTLRQQARKSGAQPNLALADFLHAEGDWIGAFAVCAGHGIEPHLARFAADHD